MTEIGKVLKVKGQYATVRIGRHTACSSCGKCGIGTKNLHVDFFALNSVDAKVGDTVKLDIKEINTLKLSFFAYVLPLAFGIGLFFLSVALKWHDLIGLLMLFGGVGLGFGVVMLVNKLKKGKWADAPTIISIEQPENGENAEVSTPKSSENE